MTRWESSDHLSPNHSLRARTEDWIKLISEFGFERSHRQVYKSDARSRKGIRNKKRQNLLNFTPVCKKGSGFPSSLHANNIRVGASQQQFCAATDSESMSFERGKTRGSPYFITSCQPIGFGERFPTTINCFECKKRSPCRNIGIGGKMVMEGGDGRSRIIKISEDNIGAFGEFCFGPWNVKIGVANTQRSSTKSDMSRVRDMLRRIK